jgi:hypothetical protein
MDLYISSMLLGVIGLGAMALSGFGHQGHGGHGHGHGDIGHSHAGHGHAGDAHGGHGHHHDTGHSGSHGFSLWALMSPRMLFSLALGFGLAGQTFARMMPGKFLEMVAAFIGAMAFEALLMRPLWNLIMKFESGPALTLESSVDDEATAVTSFDANGQGIVSLELDGQVVQVLATLTSGDRDLGVRVRAGQRVRIEDVNPATNQCTVRAV